MKTSFKTLMIALALGTTTVFAGPGSDAKKPTSFATGIYTSKDGALRVNIEKKKPVTVMLSILNSRGEELYREYLSKNESEAAYRIDLANLPGGSYSVQVEARGEKKITPFTISSKMQVVERTLTLD